MAMYCGIDLHSNNCYVSILDDEQRDVFNRRVKNDLGVVLACLEPYRDELEQIAVESTYNWYWLVDGLTEAGYDVRLVNTAKAADRTVPKYTDDRHDARKIAWLMVMRSLPEGYIMPPAERSLRDLVRTRSLLVRKRTSLLLALMTRVARSTGQQTSSRDIMKWTRKDLDNMLKDDYVVAAIQRIRSAVRCLSREIKQTEKIVLAKGILREDFELLKTVPGLGILMALTIMCETGDISRFASVGHYASYCRCVKSERRSNDKRKGSGNRKNGNKYLSWAYSEVACHARQVEPLIKRWSDRKRRRSHKMVADRALANKMARACYYVMRDQVPFDLSRAFC